MVNQEWSRFYTELTSLQKGENESTTDYTIRAETAATALKTAEEVISDGLLIAMVLKGIPRNYKTFSTVIIQREKKLTFSEFKTALRNNEENEKSCNSSDSKDSIMYSKENSLENASNAISKNTKVLNAGWGQKNGV